MTNGTFVGVVRNTIRYYGPPRQSMARATETPEQQGRQA
jgi:hypothetical protein